MPVTTGRLRLLLDMQLFTPTQYQGTPIEGSYAAYSFYSEGSHASILENDTIRADQPALRDGEGQASFSEIWDGSSVRSVFYF